MNRAIHGSASTEQSGGGLRRREPGRPRLLALLAVLLVILAGLLVFATSGCGGEEASVESDLASRIAEARGAEAEPTPASFISLCANCHDKLDPGPDDLTNDWRLERKLIFNHPAHFARGIRCQACHQEFPHKPGRTDHVPIETCFTCHGSLHGPQGVVAPTNCDACHTSDIAKVTPEHQASNWLLAKGEPLAEHGQKAKKSELYCKMCHEATFCQSCHNMDIPHPEDWVPSHNEVAAEKRAACLMCHETVKSCDDCHHEAFPELPDWSAQHRSVATGQGAEDCFTCHEPPFCSSCHVTTSKKRGVLGG